MSLRLAILALALCAACDHDIPPPQQSSEQAHPDWPPTAQVAVAEAMLASVKAPIHAADGAGKVWLEPDPPPDAACQSAYRIAVIFEAGPLGVVAGGVVFLQVSPFWGWSTPQVEHEDAPGFTRVTTAAEGVGLEPRTIDQNLLAVTIRGRALAPGERLRFDYGTGVVQARSDEFAEADSRFWIAVDGDGDGVRAPIPRSPTVRVLPLAPAMLVALAPSVARPGEEIVGRLSVVDAIGNACWNAAGRFEIVELPEELELAAQLAEASLAGTCELRLRAKAAGTVRVKVRWTPVDGGAPLAAESNPIQVSDSSPRILWADLHGHSSRSDGTGTPADYYRYAREVAALDVAALTDHDHWGILPLDQHPEILDEIRAAARRYDEPGRFVALLGFEWTSWIWGHRHVLFFDDEWRIFSSLDPESDTPQKLWALLRGKPVLTIPHHPAGGPIAIDWRIAPDRELEPLVEVCSAHGSSEAADSPSLIYSAVPGCFARDALLRGYELGFLASGDSHDGHPGLCQLGGHYPTGGVAAVFAEDRTRAGVLEALRARRVYATSGPRMLLRFAVGSNRMGSIVPARDMAKTQTVFASVVGTTPIVAVELIRKGEVALAVAGTGARELTLAGQLTDFVPGDFVYVRAIQEGGGLCWSSPVFVR